MNLMDSPYLLKCYDAFSNDFMFVFILDYCPLSLADILDKVKFSNYEALFILLILHKGIDVSNL